MRSSSAWQLPVALPLFHPAGPRPLAESSQQQQEWNPKSNGGAWEGPTVSRSGRHYGGRSKSCRPFSTGYLPGIQQHPGGPRLDIHHQRPCPPVWQLGDDLSAGSEQCRPTRKVLVEGHTGLGAYGNTDTQFFRAATVAFDARRPPPVETPLPVPFTFSAWRAKSGCRRMKYNFCA